MTLFSLTDPTTTAIYPLSLHDALPICQDCRPRHLRQDRDRPSVSRLARHRRGQADRKSTRLNSSHITISYAVFCLKKKSSYICLSSRRAAVSSVCQTIDIWITSWSSAV